MFRCHVSFREGKMNGFHPRVVVFLVMLKTRRTRVCFWKLRAKIWFLKIRKVGGFDEFSFLRQNRPIVSGNLVSSTSVSRKTAVKNAFVLPKKTWQHQVFFLKTLGFRRLPWKKSKKKPSFFYWWDKVCSWLNFALFFLGTLCLFVCLFQGQWASWICFFGDSLICTLVNHHLGEYFCNFFQASLITSKYIVIFLRCTVVVSPDLPICTSIGRVDATQWADWVHTSYPLRICDTTRCHQNSE